ASYLMYPKVYVDFSRTADQYGPTSILPTLTYFYGMAPGDEILADLERGKTMVVLFQAVGETDEQGMRTVFFETNGEPRII
ncbi:hypothetical protein J8J27_33865, partial [Mycobacterium tuberculosis]|nr:hypothetical protein [Mycobacterium tuberculosis]